MAAWGLPLNSTGVHFLADGDLYFTDQLCFLTACRFGKLDCDTDGFAADVKYAGLALGIGMGF